MKIIIDAMGGDNAPQAATEGALLAVSEYGCEITLVGDEERIKPLLEGKDNAEKITVLTSTLRGESIVLCHMMYYLKCLMHMISPQMHCHQSPKPLGYKYALTISPFLVD